MNWIDMRKTLILLAIFVGFSCINRVRKTPIEIAESLSAGLVIDWDLANVAHVVIK